MKKNTITNTYVNDDLKGIIKLTTKEIKIFEQREWNTLYNAGLKNLSGGYAKIEVVDWENGDKHILLCNYEYGIEGEYKHYGKCTFNRKTKKFDYR